MTAAADHQDKDEWTQDSVWYNVEGTLRALGIAIGRHTRAYVKKLIRELCEEAGVTRESIGIIAAPRCTMYVDERWISVTFDKIDELAEQGTDIIFMEKLDTVRSVGKHLHRYGIALVNSQGHLAEYGKDLIEAAEASGANLGIFTDDDKHGHMIAEEAPGEIVRLGVDDEMMDYFGLDKSQPISHKIDGVLSVVGSEALAEYLMERMKKEYPTRDYNRVISTSPFLSKHYPQAIQDFDLRIRSYVESLIFEEQQNIEEELEEVEGFIDVQEKRDEIDGRLGKIIESDENLKEIASKLAELKPLLDKIDNLTKEKQKEKDRKKQQEKERQSKEREELKKRFEDSGLEIQDVPGVGPTTARKLKETGIISVVDPSNAEDLVDAMYFHLSSKERKELVEHIAKHIAAAKKQLEEKEKKED